MNLQFSDFLFYQINLFKKKKINLFKMNSFNDGDHNR